MNSTKCEICFSEAVAEIFISEISTAFVVCESCRTVLDGMQRDGSFVKFEEIPQEVRDEIVKGECGGWDTREHMTEFGELLYVLVDTDKAFSEENIMFFCRFCFREYMRYEKKL